MQKILANIKTNCLFLLTQLAIAQQYEHTYKMIDSEESNDNKKQEEIYQKRKTEIFYSFLTESR